MAGRKGSLTGRCQGCNHPERVRIERFLSCLPFSPKTLTKIPGVRHRGGAFGHLVCSGNVSNQSGDMPLREARRRETGAWRIMLRTEPPQTGINSPG
jgi:hypothetical protein